MKEENQILKQQLTPEIEDLIAQGKISEALPLLRQLAHWGDVESQKELVQIYLHGKYGMPLNPYAGAEYARLAAFNSDPDAMKDLADLLAKGSGIAKDEKAAHYYYKKAAELGNGKAMEELAMQFLMGKGVSKDLKQAMEWMEKADSLLPDDEQAKKHLRLIRLASESENK